MVLGFSVMIMLMMTISTIIYIMIAGHEQADSTVRPKKGCNYLGERAREMCTEGEKADS